MAGVVDERAPLTERDRELDRVAAAAAAAARHRSPRLVLVTGDAGVGKTRLVAEAIDALPAGWCVVDAAASQAAPGGLTPFAGLCAVPADAAAPAAALAAELARVLAERRGDAPVVLVVDDLQALDPLAAEALRELLVVAAAEPLLVLATYRHGVHPLGSPTSRAVGALLRHPAAAELRVAPLSPAAAGRVASALGVRPDDVAGLVARAEGIPLLIEQLAAAPDTVPRSAAESVAAALATLPGPTVEVAEVLAAAGSLAPDELAAFDVDGTAARRLIDAGLALAEGAHLRPRHGLLAEALVDATPAARRAAHHRRLAELRAARPTTPAEVLARHWAEAGDLHRARPHALVAADRLATQGAFATAIDLYRIALAPADGDEPDEGPDLPERAAVFERAATAAARAGETALAAAWADEGRIAPGGSTTAVPLAVTWGNPLFRRLARQQTTASPAPSPSLDRVAADLARAAALVRDGDLAAARPVALAAAEGARRAGDRVLEADAALAVGYAGDLDTGLALLADIAEDARADGDVGAATVALGRSARLHLARGDTAPALAQNLESLALARARGAPEFWASPQTGTAFLHALRGELSAARQLADDLLALGNPVFTVFAHGVAWLLAIEQEDGDGAALGFDQVLAVSRAFGDDYFLVPMLMLGGRATLLAGDAAGALALFVEADARRWSPMHEQTVDILAGRARAALALGDLGDLAHVVDDASALARVVPGPAVQGLAELAHASARRANGDADAVVRYQRAARAFERAGRVPLAADAWIGAAETAAALGAPDLAPATLADAVGAARSLAERSGLRRAALDALDPGPVPAAHPLDALAPRSRRIVELAAAGRTNREIGDELYLSEKTVRNLLTAAFATLGVQRRSQLAPLLGGSS